jgi:hypothetical protein
MVVSGTSIARARILTLRLTVVLLVLAGIGSLPDLTSISAPAAAASRVGACIAIAVGA